MAKKAAKLHSPLMWAFRAMDDPDYRAMMTRQSDTAQGEQALRSGRRFSRSYGISERALLSEVRQDLQSLFNTINLNSTQNLSDFPEVAGSILNYGLPDLSVYVVDTVQVGQLAKAIHNAILRFEPRMDPASLQVERDETSETGQFLVRFFIKAILRCDPIRVSSEFVADLDPGLGRLKITGAST